MLYNLPSSGGVFLAYIVPAYLLAGLHREDAEEPLFSGGSLLGKVFFQYIGMSKEYYDIISIHYLIFLKILYL